MDYYNVLNASERERIKSKIYGKFKKEEKKYKGLSLQEIQYECIKYVTKRYFELSTRYMRAKKINYQKIKR